MREPLLATNNPFDARHAPPETAGIEVRDGEDPDREDHRNPRRSDLR